MTERFKPIKPLPKDSMGEKDPIEKMVEEAKKTPKDAMKRVGKFKGGMLKGGQKKLDANKDGKISGDDFAMLRGKKMVKAEKGKMGGGMIREPMGYRAGGGVRGGRKEIKGLRPPKLF